MRMKTMTLVMTSSRYLTQCHKYSESYISVCECPAVFFLVRPGKPSSLTNHLFANMNRCLCKKSFSTLKTLLHFERSQVVQVQKLFKSDKNDVNPFDDPGFPRVGLSKDRRTIAMFHPPRDILFSETVEIPRDDKRYSAFTTADDIVSERLQQHGISEKSVEYGRNDHFFPMFDRDLPSTANELGKVFYTSKHRWFYKRRPKRFFEEYNKQTDRPTS